MLIMLGRNLFFLIF